MLHPVLVVSTTTVLSLLMSTIFARQRRQFDVRGSLLYRFGCTVPPFARPAKKKTRHPTQGKERPRNFARTLGTDRAESETQHKRNEGTKHN